jgi:hypothetical protein
LRAIVERVEELVGVLEPAELARLLEVLQHDVERQAGDRRRR